MYRIHIFISINKQILKFYIAILLLSAIPAFPMTLQGNVILTRGNAVWFRVSDREVIAQLGPEATLVGVTSLKDLNKGDAIRVEYSREIAGVLLAEELYAEPPALLDPRYSVKVTELQALLDQGASLVDARSKEDFNSGHIPEAISIPAGDFASRIHFLPEDKSQPVIFYSNGPRCTLSHKALRKALELGYQNAKVFEEGIPAWDRTRHLLVAEPEGLRTLAQSGLPILFFDLRPMEESRQAHLPGAFTLPPETMTAQILSSPYGMPDLVIYGEDENDSSASDAAQKILGWRYDQSNAPDGWVRVLRGGLKAWVQLGMPAEKGERILKTSDIVLDPMQISSEEFRSKWAMQDAAGLFLDVRWMPPEQWGWVKNVPLEELPQRILELPKQKEILVFCDYGKRSAIAARILRNNGYKARFLKGHP